MKTERAVLKYEQKNKGDNFYNIIGILFCADEYFCQAFGRFTGSTEKFFQKSYCTYCGGGRSAYWVPAVYNPFGTRETA